MIPRPSPRALPLAAVLTIALLSGPAGLAGPFAGTAFAAPARPAPAQLAPAQPAPPPAPALVPGTPCATGYQACVSLGDQRAWLTDGAKVVSGPIDIVSGGPGQETPAGSFAVQWKNRDHKSGEHKTPEGLPSPMPFAVFFAAGGIAFHEGTMDRPSAGCVRLPRAEAERYFNTLRVGDKVQVLGG